MNSKNREFKSCLSAGSIVVHKRSIQCLGPLDIFKALAYILIDNFCPCFSYIFNKIFDLLEGSIFHIISLFRHHRYIHCFILMNVEWVREVKVKEGEGPFSL